MHIGRIHLGWLACTLVDDTEPGLCQLMQARTPSAVCGSIKTPQPYLLTAAAPCRHVAEGRGDTPALLWEGNEPGTDRTMTYSDTLAEVSRLVGNPAWLPGAPDPCCEVCTAAQQCLNVAWWVMAQSIGRG